MKFSQLLIMQAIALLAFAEPALAQAPSEAEAMPPIPVHHCVAPEYPSKPASKLRVDAFNRDYKAYGDCMKKYVEDTNRWLKAVTDAVNKAIDDYNKYTEDLKNKIEAEK